MKIKIEVDGYECNKCGYVWVPRSTVHPTRQCPSCKSTYFDDPRLAPATKATPRHTSPDAGLPTGKPSTPDEIGEF